MTEQIRPRITVGQERDGLLVYVVEMAPDALPPVRSGDLADAWTSARHAAVAASWGTPRVFRFVGEDDASIDLALIDEDASCWAAAVDRTAPLQTPYGLSLCLRLLALVEALAASSWLSLYCRIGRAGATLDPALIRAAATIPLTPQAGFDDQLLRSRLGATAPRSLGFDLTCAGANI